MAAPAQFSRGHGPRKSILDLAPLELGCMNTLWPLGEGTVREIQRGLAPSRPRAYTTIMTIMDRLANKGIVTRRKVGRAYLYRPSLTAEEARGHAVARLVEGFFDGSLEALAAHLAGNSQVSVRPRAPEPRPAEPVAEQPRAPDVEEPEQPSNGFSTTRLDETLL